ncbi:3'-5' exonuclease [Niveibacterium sp. SC-1]|uniref:3'-5' exonuclease n=1 Tax=Niveibacterium sp. SC-1 TaxID=3135646 RepID=UPI00311DDBF7
MTKHVMIDIETLGTSHLAAIAAIGAVEFDPRGSHIDGGFYCHVDVEDAVRSGMRIEGTTVKWWLGQGDEARGELAKPRRPLPLAKALERLAIYLAGNVATEDTRDELQVWAKGTSFDFGILRCAFDLTRQPLPWRYWNERDYRTIARLVPAVEAPARQGTAHNALSDAIHQAQHLQRILTHAPAEALL